MWTPNIKVIIHVSEVYYVTLRVFTQQLKKDKKSDLFNPTITLIDHCVSKRECLCNMSSRDNRDVAWEVSVGKLLHLQSHDTKIENRKWKAP